MEETLHKKKKTLRKTTTNPLQQQNTNSFAKTKTNPFQKQQRYLAKKNTTPCKKKKISQKNFAKKKKT